MLKAATKKPSRVTVCVDATKTLGRVTFQAVLEYMRRNECDWILQSATGNRLWLPSEIDSLPLDRLDGVISFTSNASLIRKMKKAGVRFVGIYDDSPDRSIPSVLSDNEAIGRLAGRHLHELNVKTFAYYGTDLVNNSEARFGGLASFLEEVRAGKPAHIKAGVEDIMGGGPGKRAEYLERLGRELSALANGGRDALGVFAYGDSMGITVIEACRAVGLAVPEKAAVVAVAMDEIICELSVPSLTSIQQDARKIGLEAAAMLDGLLQGREPENRRVVVPPLGVRVRASTDCVATEDPYVAKAVQLIRERFRDKLNVNELCLVLKVSRRVLEERFQRALGRAPYEEITRMRLRYAEGLLAQTSETNLAIALESGFSNAVGFEQAFRKAMGLSPGEYRKKFTYSS